MQFDAVGMLHCHGELLGASSLLESLTFEWDGEGKDRGGAGSGTHHNEASLAQTRGVEQTHRCRPIVVLCHHHPMPLLSLVIDVVVPLLCCVSVRQVGKKVCLLWYFMIKNNKEQRTWVVIRRLAATSLTVTWHLDSVLEMWVGRQVSLRWAHSPRLVDACVSLGVLGLFVFLGCCLGGHLHLWVVVFVCGRSWAVVEWSWWWRWWVVIVVGRRVVVVTGGMVGLLCWWLL